MPVMRIDKFLSNLSFGSRKDVKKLISSARIRINDKVVKKAEEKLDTYKDKVFVDDRLIEYEEFEYHVLNKPVGYICATEDRKHKTVMELISSARRDLSPVGRLDIDTEGLLLVSNDGMLAHNLISPSKNVAKQYFAKVSGRLPLDAEDIFAKGMILEEGFITKPALLKVLKRGDELSEISLVIYEGKYHQVKRMFEYIDCKVEYLQRTAFANLILEELNLKLGESRKLNTDELKKLKEIYA